MSNTVVASEKFDTILDTIFDMGMQIGINRSKFKSEEAYNIWKKEKFDENYLETLCNLRDDAYDISKTCDIEKDYKAELKKISDENYKLKQENNEAIRERTDAFVTLGDLKKKIKDMNEVEWRIELGKQERKIKDLTYDIEDLEEELENTRDKHHVEVDDFEMTIKNYEKYDKFVINTAVDQLKFQLLINAYNKYTLEELENNLEVSCLEY